jgi:hypothetical protein
MPLLEPHSVAGGGDHMEWGSCYKGLGPHSVLLGLGMWNGLYNQKEPCAHDTLVIFALVILVIRHHLLVHPFHA